MKPGDTVKRDGDTYEILGETSDVYYVKRIVKSDTGTQDHAIFETWIKDKSALDAALTAIWIVCVFVLLSFIGGFIAGLFVHQRQFF